MKNLINKTTNRGTHRIATRTAMCALTGALVLSMLTACVPLVLGGAVMGGLIATDRRTSGTVVEDQGIELKAATRVRDLLGERGHVTVTSYNRQVLITGEVPSAQDKDKVEQAIKGLENVQKVLNELAVMDVSTFSQRTNDTYISGLVKTRLLDAKDLHANAFKIVTERAVVYVMGRVTQRESQRGTEVISGTERVQKVVRMLEIISEEELARIQPPAPAK